MRRYEWSGECLAAVVNGVVNALLYDEQNGERLDFLKGEFEIRQTCKLCLYECLLAVFDFVRAHFCSYSGGKLDSLSNFRVNMSEIPRL